MQDIEIKAIVKEYNVVENGMRIAIKFVGQDGQLYRLQCFTTQVDALLNYFAQARSTALQCIVAAGIQKRIDGHVNRESVEDAKTYELLPDQNEQDVLMRVTTQSGKDQLIRFPAEAVTKVADEWQRAATYLNKCENESVMCVKE